MSTSVIADWVVFPPGGCTLNGPLQLVPGLLVVHCPQAIGDNAITKPIIR
jgi:hypothetical protein